MANSSNTAGPFGPTAKAELTRPSRLMARIYRDIGLAAVASELALLVDDLEPELIEAVKRGSRYLYLMPASERTPARG
jgi:hypothetical protein